MYSYDLRSFQNNLHQIQKERYLIDTLFQLRSVRFAFCVPYRNSRDIPFLGLHVLHAH